METCVNQSEMSRELCQLIREEYYLGWGVRWDLGWWICCFLFLIRILPCTLILVDNHVINNICTLSSSGDGRGTSGLRGWVSSGSSSILATNQRSALFVSTNHNQVFTCHGSSIDSTLQSLPAAWTCSGSRSWAPGGSPRSWKRTPRWPLSRPGRTNQRLEQFSVNQSESRFITLARSLLTMVYPWVITGSSSPSQKSSSMHRHPDNNTWSTNQRSVNILCWPIRSKWKKFTIRIIVVKCFMKK